MAPKRCTENDNLGLKVAVMYQDDDRGSGMCQECDEFAKSRHIKKGRCVISIARGNKITICIIYELHGNV